jgi:predicted 3-demethylubiquinone-9 3-methyltransferase (glyoxalase superfamily)
MCIDSPVKHAFTFTPAISIYINCKRESEIDSLFEKLSNGGQIFMPLNKYPFSDKFGWCTDKYLVSWQVNLKN